MVVSKAIDAMTELGFGENEARTYLALLPLEPATAYELAKVSGVPGSKIYQILERLAEKEAVIRIDESGKVLWAAQTPKELLAKHRAQTEKTLRELEGCLEEIEEPSPANYVWNIRSRDELMIRCSLLVQSARGEITASGYKEELDALAPVLQEAECRGCKVAVVHFGPWAAARGMAYYHPIAETLATEHGGRMLTLVADGSMALNATISTSGAVEGAWSRNSSFVQMAADYIRHDMYLTKIIKRLDKELIELFDSDYRLLRDVHNDRDLGSIRSGT